MAGFGLNLKLVFLLAKQSLTESLGFLNPPLLQAAKRCVQPYSNTSKKAYTDNITLYTDNIILFIDKIISFTE